MAESMLCCYRHQKETVLFTTLTQPLLTSEGKSSICFITTYITIRQGIVVISVEMNH